jgi:hypothetical protein
MSKPDDGDEHGRLRAPGEGAGGKIADRKYKQAIWQPISEAPFDRDLRLAIIDQRGVSHALVFPCRRVLGGWLKAETKARIDVEPTHWQEWAETD